jgi:hypothetical protein
VRWNGGSAKGGWGWAADWKLKIENWRMQIGSADGGLRDFQSQISNFQFSIAAGVGRDAGGDER